MFWKTTKAVDTKSWYFINPEYFNLYIPGINLILTIDQLSICIFATIVSAIVWAFLSLLGKILSASGRRRTQKKSSCKTDRIVQVASEEFEGQCLKRELLNRKASAAEMPSSANQDVEILFQQKPQTFPNLSKENVKVDYPKQDLKVQFAMGDTDTNDSKMAANNKSVISNRPSCSSPAAEVFTGPPPGRGILCMPSIVTLHQFPRPCSSQNHFFLESVLRLCEIPYQVIYDASEVLPWICYGELKIKGIKCCMEFLNGMFSENVQKYQVPEASLVPAQFLSTLVEYKLIGAVNYWKLFIETKGDVKQLDFQGSNSTSPVKNTVVTEFVQRNFHGRQEEKELLEFIETDLVALSASLGNKDVFIGKSITILDCRIFSTLANCLWDISDNTTNYDENELSSLQKLIKRHSNLVDFCNNIRSVLWPKWETKNFGSQESYYCINSTFVKGQASKA